MEFTEREVLIAEQLKKAGLPWRPRQGDYCADSSGTILLVTRELADKWVHEDYQLMNRTWLPMWHQCRMATEALGFLLRDHCEDVEIHEGKRSRYVGIAVESIHRGRYAAEGNTDLEAFYELLFKVMTATAQERKISTRTGRIQGKVCQQCLGFMKLKEIAGAWQYHCESCARPNSSSDTKSAATSPRV